jgi:hypothetical protein
VNNWLEWRELKMLIELVQWRVNMLGSLASVDGAVAEQRRGWLRVLVKLERMRNEL